MGEAEKQDSDASALCNLSPRMAWIRSYMTHCASRYRLCATAMPISNVSMLCGLCVYVGVWEWEGGRAWECVMAAVC